MARFNFDVRRHLPSTMFVGVAAVLLAAFASIFVYVGAYNIAGDDPHIKPVYWVLEKLRNQSIAARARGIAVPADFGSATRISTGAGLYTEMCAGCHLGPGVERSEMSQGLYPQAPDLAREAQRLSPAEQFWIIKHGIKLSAMPAWGRTHPDPLIWDMVAFVRQLPKMSAAQYQAAIASAPADHDETMKAMPGMKATPEAK